jgi:hypothetical protein
MVGVTLFGIFLTPVFFYVIEGLAETPLFAAARVRLVGRVLLYLLGILTLGLPWLLVFVTGRALQRRRTAVSSRPVPLPAANGAAAHGPPAALAPNGEAVTNTGNGHEKSPSGDGAPAAGTDHVIQK